MMFPDYKGTFLIQNFRLKKLLLGAQVYIENSAFDLEKEISMILFCLVSSVDKVKCLFPQS